MMELIDKFIRKLTLRTAQIGQLALAVVMLVIVANIILRRFWKPLPGTVEIVEICGAVVLSLGVAYCAVSKGHTAVGVLLEKLSQRKEAVVESVTSLISLSFISLLGWETMVYGSKMMARGYTTGHLLIPLYPFIFLVGFGFIMLAFVLLMDFFKCLRAILILKGSEE